MTSKNRKIEKKDDNDPERFLLRHRFDDFDELTESIQGWNLEFRKLDCSPFTSELMLLKSGSTLLTRFLFKNRLELRGDTPQAGFRRFGIPVTPPQSSVWRGKVLKKKTIQIFPSDSELEATSPSHLVSFVLLFSEELLTKLAQTLHIPLPWELPEKPEIVDGDPGELEKFHQTLQHVSRSITGHPSTLDNPRLRHELEFEIPQQLLTLLSHAYPARFRPLARHRSRALKQALTYITDYAGEPPTILDMCQATGVSQRTLEYAFLERFGVTPKTYLQAYRLNRVRKTLRQADPGATKIIDVANRWGFWHMGQFARDYQKLFGELPSKTLRH